MCGTCPSKSVGTTATSHCDSQRCKKKDAMLREDQQHSSTNSQRAHHSGGTTAMFCCGKNRAIWWTQSKPVDTENRECTDDGRFRAHRDTLALLCPVLNSAHALEPRKVSSEAVMVPLQQAAADLHTPDHLWSTALQPAHRIQHMPAQMQDRHMPVRAKPSAGHCPSASPQD